MRLSVSRSIALATVVIFLPLAVNAQIIPSDRIINWDPGVRGGIPTRTTVFQTVPVGGNIQLALNNCPSGQVVQLISGTYSISSPLTIPSNVTLRGVGMGMTIIKGASGFNDSVLVQFDNGYDSNWAAPERSLVSPAKGATTITTTGNHGWSENNIVLIDMLENPAGDPPVQGSGHLGNCTWCGRPPDVGERPFGQWVKIVSVPTLTTAIIDPPLYYSYYNQPKGVQMRGLTHYGGIEDLTINNAASRAGEAVLGIYGAINCWAYRVEITGIYKKAIHGYGALWFTMQGSRVHGAIPIGADRSPQYDSDRAYGFFMGPHFSAGLVTDTIFDEVTMGVSFEGAAAGNVFSYNFINDVWWKETDSDPADRDYPQRFGPLMHGPHPFMNLVEGNWSGGRIRHDEYWGTSSHFTYLRNRVIQVNRANRGEIEAQRWTVDIERRNQYMNFVGNVLGGGPDVKETNYELINGESAPYQDSKASIWKIGYKSLGSGSDLYDNKTLSSMLRWGNWCYRTSDSVAGSSITYSNNNVVNTNDTTIPQSYYLTSKPSWFDSYPGNPSWFKFSDSDPAYPWPPYDPAVDKSHDDCTPRIPAHARFMSFKPNARPFNSCGPADALAPAAPINLRLKP